MEESSLLGSVREPVAYRMDSSIQQSMSPEQEKPITQAVQNFVMERLALGLPGTHRPRRNPRSFTIEVLDYDDEAEEPMVTAAGPVELEDSGNPLELFLKVIAPLKRTARFKWEVVMDDRIRAAYIIENGDDVGTCKEVAAIANA